jgi:hypothetical protein
VLGAAALLAGCGGGADSQTSSRSEPTATSIVRDDKPSAKPPPTLERARCPAGATNCATATGPIFYEERVDPDGDGDAHLVIADDSSITLPGLTVIDVEANLRPHPLPGEGDWVSAAGPVYPGSYGQHQIQATELNLER